MNAFHERVSRVFQDAVEGGVYDRKENLEAVRTVGGGGRGGGVGEGRRDSNKPSITSAALSTIDQIRAAQSSKEKSKVNSAEQVKDESVSKKFPQKRNASTFVSGHETVRQKAVQFKKGNVPWNKGKKTGPKGTKKYKFNNEKDDNDEEQVEPVSAPVPSSNIEVLQKYTRYLSTLTPQQVAMQMLMVSSASAGVTQNVAGDGLLPFQHVQQQQSQNIPAYTVQPPKDYQVPPPIPEVHECEGSVCSRSSEEFYI